MFLTIGDNEVLFDSDIIGIFDLDNTTESKWTREFLSNAVIQNSPEDLPKAFIVTEKDTYLSVFSPATLKGRL